MLKRKFKYFALTLILTAFTSANADVNIHEGMWEITNKIEMSGMPMQIPETTISQCIDKDKIIPKTNKDVNKYCTISEQKIEGDTVTWKMKCTNKMQAHGSITYYGETFEGLITIIVEIPNMGSMEMINHITGKRTGDCE